MSAVSTREVTVWILNGHTSNEDKENFFKQIANVIATKASGRRFMAGDFNAVLNGRSDRFSPDLALNKSKVLNNLTTELELPDA